MSYDLWVFPAATLDVDETVRAETPSSPATVALAATLTAAARAADLPLSIEPLEPQGETIVVPTPFSAAQQARNVIIPAAFAAGYAVHDPQLGLDLDPRTAVAGTLSTDDRGDFPVITPGLIDQLMAVMAVDDFLIVGLGDQVYMQSARRADDVYQLEYRAGSAQEHYGTEVATAAQVAAAMRGWLAGDEASYRDYDWAKVAF